MKSECVLTQVFVTATVILWHQGTLLWRAMEVMVRYWAILIHLFINKFQLLYHLKFQCQVIHLQTFAFVCMYLFYFLTTKLNWQQMIKYSLGQVYKMINKHNHCVIVLSYSVMFKRKEIKSSVYKILPSEKSHYKQNKSHYIK